MVELGGQHQRHKHLRTITDLQKEFYFLSGKTNRLVNVIPYPTAKRGVTTDLDCILIGEATFLALFGGKVAESA